MMTSIQELITVQEFDDLQDLKEWLEMDELPTAQDIREFMGYWMYVEGEFI
jgi:hypothetical protein